jgi:hypothetical protein
LPGRYAPALKVGKEAAMPNYDVIVYHDLSSLVASVRPGDAARELGDICGAKILRQEHPLGPTSDVTPRS